MSKKSFMKLFVVVLVVCLAVCVFVSCDKNKGNTPDDYRPGDVVVSEKDVTWTVDSDGNIVMGEYQGKDIVVKYLLDNASYLVLSGQEAGDMAITGYHGEIKSFSLKEIESRTSVNGSRISVTSVMPNTFLNCETLEEVDLSKSSRALSFEIGANAFKFCVSLAKVTLPDNLYVNDNVIGTSAFERCTALSIVNIGDKFTAIDSRAFAYCTSLESIQLPSGIKDISDYTFFGCEKLSRISFTGENAIADIPEGAPSDTIDTVAQPELALRKIGSYAFANTAFFNGDFGKFTNLRVIGEYAFYNTYISELVIPSNVSRICEKAFYNLGGLESVDIPFLGNTIAENGNWNFNSVYGMNRDDFWYSRELNVTVREAANIPATAFASSDVKSVSISYFGEGEDIGSAFIKVYGMDGVSFTEETVVIQDSIPERAFYNCSDLTELRLAHNPSVIGERAFENCEKLASFPISNNLRYIYDRAFAGCYGLTSITVPSSVEHIGEGVFADCKALTSIEFESYFFNFREEEVIVYYDNLANLSTYFAKNTYLNTVEGEEEMYLTNGVGNHVYVPKALKTVKAHNMYYVPAYMFDGFSGLTDIVLTMEEAPVIEDYVDNNIGKIGDGAFYNCSSLANLTINDEDGVITSIGENAFSGCEKLDGFEISENIKEIGSYAFRNTGFTSFMIPATLPHDAIGTSILADCTKLASIEIEDYDFARYDSEVGYYRYVSFGSLSKLFGSNTTLNREDYIVRDELTGEITSDNFPMYKTSESWGVYVPNTLKTVKLGSTTVLSALAFNGFLSLTAIEIEWVDNISDYNYNGEQQSEDLHPAIGNSAFADCIVLSTLTFTGETVNPDKIGQNAFQFCASLTSLPVVLPVGFGFVNGCTSLREVTVQLPTSVYNWYLASLFNTSSNASSNIVLNEIYTELTKVTLVSTSGGQIPANLLRGTENVTNVVFTAEDIAAIGENAFAETQLQTGSTDYLVTFNGWVIGTKSTMSFVVVPATAKGIADNALGNVVHVFFDGTSDQWNNVRYGNLYNAYPSKTVYFYSVSEPVSSGNYWHYEDESQEAIQVWGGATFGIVTYDVSYGNGMFEYIKIEAPNPLTAADINLPVIEGKVFDGWYADAEKTIAITLPYNGENGKAIYAAWRDLTQYTLVINEDITLTAWGDGQLTEDDLPDFSEYNVIVAVWYTDAEKTNRVELPYIGTETTLYAYCLETASYSFTSSTSYTFASNEAGWYYVTNLGINSSTAQIKLVADEDMVISFNYELISESGYDKLTITIERSNGSNETIINERSGSIGKEAIDPITLSAGDKIVFSYTKDGSSSANGEKVGFGDIIAVKPY